MKRIPIKVAREVAEKTGSRQVILLAWDGARTHVVTYGVSVEDCAQAAAGGNLLKKKLGWPEELMAESARIKKRKAEIEIVRQKMLERARNIKQLQ